MVKAKVLFILTAFLLQLSQAQQVFVDQEVAAPFFSVVKDLRKHNVCVEETIGPEGIIVAFDKELPKFIIAVADGTYVCDVIMIRYNSHFPTLSFQEQKFIFLHELMHHKQFFHGDRILAMQAYYEDIPDYYKIALAQAAILLAE